MAVVSLGEIFSDENVLCDKMSSSDDAEDKKNKRDKHIFDSFDRSKSETFLGKQIWSFMSGFFKQ